MGHKMTHVDDSQVVIGGYLSDLLEGIEFFTGEGWENHPGELEFGR